MAGVFSPALVIDEETDEEDDTNDVFLIILYPSETSEQYVRLPRNSNTKFADLRRKIVEDDYLHIPPYHFFVNVDSNVSFTVKIAQEKEWKFNKFGNVEGKGKESNPFRIYVKQQTDVYKIIMYPNKSSEFTLTLPRNNWYATTFADLRQMIQDYLDIPSFRFVVNVDNIFYSVKSTEEEELRWRLRGNGTLCNPFSIYLKEEGSSTVEDPEEYPPTWIPDSIVPER